MGYDDALKAAGFQVIDFAQFGSYQGDWCAFVFKDNKYGFITDFYGSCSGCDAFEGSISDPEDPKQLKAFGEQYLDAVITFDEMLAKASKNKEWDQESLTMIDWVKKHQYENDFHNLVNKDE